LRIVSPYELNPTRTINLLLGIGLLTSILGILAAPIMLYRRYGLKYQKKD
jgi:hypothetical protein